MKELEWRIVTPEEQAEQERLNELYMDPVLRFTCPYCGVGYGFNCLTRDGEWAAQSHAKRRKLYESPGSVRP